MILDQKWGSRRNTRVSMFPDTSATADEARTTRPLSASKIEWRKHVHFCLSTEETGGSFRVGHILPHCYEHQVRHTVHDSELMTLAARPVLRPRSDSFRAQDQRRSYRRDKGPVHAARQSPRKLSVPLYRLRGPLRLSHHRYQCFLSADGAPFHNAE